MTHFLDRAVPDYGEDDHEKLKDDDAEDHEADGRWVDALVDLGRLVRVQEIVSGWEKGEVVKTITENKRYKASVQSHSI